MSRIDIVSVFHNETNYRQFLDLQDMIARYERKGGWRMIGVDNRVNNRGFAAGCNYGAFSFKANAPVIGFINPDCIVKGPFMDQVMEVFRSSQEIMVTGNRFGKPKRELDFWGCRDWVCGATFFVRRDFFEKVGGFCEEYVWSWEETDFCRLVQAKGGRVRSTELPIEHDSPAENSDEDAQYKREHFDAGAAIFRRRWSAV